MADSICVRVNERTPEPVSVIGVAESILVALVGSMVALVVVALGCASVWLRFLLYKARHCLLQYLLLPIETLPHSFIQSIFTPLLQV